MTTTRRQGQLHSPHPWQPGWPASWVRGAGSGDCGAIGSFGAGCWGGAKRFGRCCTGVEFRAEIGVADGGVQRFDLDQAGGVAGEVTEPGILAVAEGGFCWGW